MVMFNFPILDRKYPNILGKFGSKNHNYQSKLKFDTKTKLNIDNSIVMFIFSVFYQKYPFSVNLVQANQNCQFKLKFGT